MLFKEVHLKGIKSGSIRIAFRKWKKAAARKGSLHQTSHGLIEITDIYIIEEGDISEKDIAASGFENREALLRSLPPATGGNLYKIELRYYSEDPRIALGSQSSLTDQELLEVKKKLERMDKLEAWTKKILLIIKGHPHQRAAELARLSGYEKEWLKLHIRKLKNLGLTISHHPGYELSPMGAFVVKELYEA